MNTRYETARERYRALGVDTEAALEKLAQICISVHCWQGDDVIGFDRREALSGGIQATGDYPGRATTPQQLMDDLDFALARIPGRKKLNLHASYAIFEPGDEVDRDALQTRHFEPWIAYARARGMGIDFNPTFFSHPMVRDGWTLSSPDETVRGFWVRHGRACLRIAGDFARRTGQPCVVNFWIPDGCKDVPADRLGPRARFRRSLDEIFAEPYDKTAVFPTLESKVFGIGLESYTVGSAEFCLSYADAHGITPLLDNGHFHPTEYVSDKLSALLLFHDKIALHLTRPVRWDSDHVVAFDDETREIAREIVRADATDRVFLATDYFDASINRVSAWITGVRSVQKALLFAMLEPHETARQLQDEGRFTEWMVLREALACAPFGDVWEAFLARSGVSEDYLPEVLAYERKVLNERS